MAGYVDVAAAEDIPPGTARQVQVGERRIGVYNVSGDLYAMDDLCSHDQAWLTEGDFDPERRSVRCPRHTSTFDLTSGRPRTLPAIRPVATYAAKFEAGRVLILIDT